MGELQERKLRKKEETLSFSPAENEARILGEIPMSEIVVACPSFGLCGVSGKGIFEISERDAYNEVFRNNCLPIVFHEETLYSREVKITKKLRGRTLLKFMESTVPGGPGRLLAIEKAKQDLVEEILDKGKKTENYSYLGISVRGFLYLVERNGEAEILEMVDECDRDEVAHEVVVSGNSNFRGMFSLVGTCDSCSFEYSVFYFNNWNILGSGSLRRAHLCVADTVYSNVYEISDNQPVDEEKEIDCLLRLCRAKDFEDCFEFVKRLVKEYRTKD